MLISVQRQKELDDLFPIVREAGVETVLELGAAQCGTALLLARELGKGSRIISIDLPELEGGTPACFEDEARKSMPNDIDFTLLRGDSTAPSTFLDVVHALGYHPVDLLIIDTVHTEAHALREYEIYRKLLSERGIVAFHDICMPELWPMWNGLRGSRPAYRSIEIIEDLRQLDCGIGLLLGR